MNPLETFLQFVEAINLHDIAAITALMTDDHLFVDSLGQQVQGASSMGHGWKAYFAMCPDYWIQANDAAARHGIVLAAGEAGHHRRPIMANSSRLEGHHPRQSSRRMARLRR